MVREIFPSNSPGTGSVGGVTTLPRGAQPPSSELPLGRHMEASSLGSDAHNWGEKGKKTFQTYMVAGNFFQNSTKMRRMDFINKPTSAELV